MSAHLQAPKGTRDLFGNDVRDFAVLETVARQVFSLYSFEEVRTPIFEHVELFARSLGDTSDVVQKEMFSFTDRGERTFALRPEGTASIVRYFIEQNLAVKGGSHRLFYMGPMFRAERPQAGRYRQFWQIGCEYFGSAEPSADADIVIILATILKSFHIGDFSIHVNSLGCKTCRQAYRETLLGYLKGKESILSAESKERMTKNPLRVLDSKVDGPKLGDAPVMKDHLCGACRAHYGQFLSLLTSASFKVEENPRLVRGLDYYNGPVFEVVSPLLGAQSAVGAGGRYDELVSSLGGARVPAVGFALGMDRVVLAHQKLEKSALPVDGNGLLIIPMVDDALPVAFALAHELRSLGYRVPPVSAKKKLKNQLSLAVDLGANWAILIGEDELKTKEITLKNLQTRTQEKIAMKDVATQLKKQRTVR